jgi:hypothetical protein
LEHIGLAAIWHRSAVEFAQIAFARRLALGAEWAPIAARTRPFAERAEAKWWLAVLERVGL